MAGERVQRGTLMETLAAQVYRQIRGRIIRGEYPAGAKLVELDIAANMGTSQGTVREALQRLEREGLVERRAHRGTFVTDLVPDEIYELFMVRSTIEGFATQRAAANMSPENLKRLETLLSDMHAAAAAQDISQLVEHDLEFHRLICELSGSRILLNAWLPLYAQIQRFVVQTHPHYFRDLKSLVDTHQPLMEALRQRDASRASQLMQEHVMLIWSWIKARSEGE